MNIDDHFYFYSQGQPGEIAVATSTGRPGNPGPKGVTGQRGGPGLPGARMLFKN